MQSNHVLSIVAVAAFGFASTMVQAEDPQYLKLKSAEVEWEAKANAKRLEFDIETQQAVPMDGKSGAFGYAGLSGDTNNVLVLVTHLPIDDSSHEQPVSGFHVHVLDLKQPTAACQGSTLEVDLENSGKNSAFDANYPWKIKGNKIEIKDVPASDLNDGGVENIVSFTLKPVLDQQQKPTNLCVNVVDKL
jgi:hypothetical protein